MLTLFGLLIAGLVAVWVYQDARDRGAHQPGLWAVGTFLLMILVLPMWLLTRPAKGSGSLRACPHCAESIQYAATVCRFCHRDVPVAVAPPVDPAFSTGFKVAMGVLSGAIGVVILAALFA
jgi:hypothetical protein